MIQEPPDRDRVNRIVLQPPVHIHITERFNALLDALPPKKVAAVVGHLAVLARRLCDLHQVEGCRGCVWYTSFSCGETERYALVMVKCLLKDPRAFKVSDEAECIAPIAIVIERDIARVTADACAFAGEWCTEDA